MNIASSLVVNGYIITDLRENALVVAQPFNGQSESTQQVFKYNGKKHLTRA